jgi:predicted ester cyclase
VPCIPATRFGGHLIHHNAPPGAPPGLEGLKQLFALYLTAFPDFKLTLEDLVAEGDMVGDRVTGKGTHTGPLLGIPPTGKKVTVTAVDAYRIANGKVAETWHIEDQVGLLTQLGVIPAPGGG